MKDEIIIKDLTDEILKDEINYGTLAEKLEAFKIYLLEITGLVIDDSENRKDLQFDNGIALCTSFAALCIDDIMRTRQYVRGTYKAILEKTKHKKEEPIHIFYAGTGPFATLILPILTRFSSSSIQLNLMDINQKTLGFLRNLIRELSLDQYINEIICEDASTYQFDPNWEIDILISETMQYGLVKEQQVPIMINMVNQLPKNTIVIPNNIQLDLAMRFKFSEKTHNDPKTKRYKTIQRLLDFNSEFMRSAHNNDVRKNQRFNLCEDVSFTKEMKSYDDLVVLTSIQVYEDEWIHVNESGLTIPKLLFNMRGIDTKSKKLSLSYVIKENPDFEFELN